MELKDLAKKRWSCRKFSPKPVDPALVEQIIETGIAAPTAVNKQPFHIFWMQSQEAKALLQQVTSCTFGADNFLVLGCRKEEGWIRPFDGHPFAEVDGSIVATHMMLEIEDLGLSTTWVGNFDAPKLKALCPAMADYELIALFPIGYAAEDAAPSERHSLRKSREALLTVL